MRKVVPLGSHNDANPHNPDCRDVSRYHITRAGATEQEVAHFIGGLVRLLQPRVVVETGTGDGSTTDHIHAALVANAYGVGFSIDIDPKRVRNVRALLPAAQPVTVLQGDATSFDWGTVLRAPEVDLAFIDGGTNRGAEFMNLLPWFSLGAFVVFHDVSNATPPRQVVEHLAQAGLVRKPLFFPTPRGLALTQVVT